jgi:CBS-domain-containing membrane protein
VRVRDIMSPSAVAVPDDVPLDVFLDRFVFGYRFSTFPIVTPDGRPTGLVTLNRVKEVPPDQRPTMRVRDVACPIDDVATASPDEAAADLLPRLAGCSDGRALVVSNGKLVGIVSPSDIARALELFRRQSGHHIPPRP